jgi:hypothetical protein
MLTLNGLCASVSVLIRSRLVTANLIEHSKIPDQN